MSTAGGQPPTEDELRAAYEAEIKKIRVEHMLLEHVVTLVNLGMRRTGLAPGTEAERDPGQVRLAIEAIRAVMPLLEQFAPEQVGQIRDALSQLQLAFVRIGGPEATAPAAGEPPAEREPQKSGGSPGGEPSGGRPGEAPGAGAPPEPPRPKPGEPGPAQRSGKLWVPGQ
jgi:hypothetical protein